MEKTGIDKHLYRLSGRVQHYDWGGDVFIPTVTGEQAVGRPLAEYWLGAHSLASSMVEDAEGRPALDKLIASDPGKFLGPQVSKQFGSLPFLLKLLDVKEMLSIQVHPSRENAAIEFERENREGIALDSPKRNYRDRNHKPELMVAMSEFWLLHGFKPSKILHAVLKRIPEFEDLLSIFNDENYTELYKSVMTMPQQQVNSTLQPLLDRIIPAYTKGELRKDQEDYWAARAALSFTRNGDIDRGIFSIYFFNLLRLEKGQAIFQDAGVPHAYLQGQNVEIMANSDNVLRGGLTTKHIDVKELLKHVKCEGVIPEIMEGWRKREPPSQSSSGQPPSQSFGGQVSEFVFRTPAPDFELSVYILEEGMEIKHQPASAEILLAVEGSCTVESGGKVLELRRGMPAAILFPGGEARLSSSGKATVFRAAIPNPQP